MSGTLEICAEYCVTFCLSSLAPCRNLVPGVSVGTVLIALRAHHCGSGCLQHVKEAEDWPLHPAPYPCHGVGRATHGWCSFK